MQGLSEHQIPLQPISHACERLYDLLCDFVKESWVSGAFQDIPSPTKRLIQNAITRLQLWGQGFDTGRIRLLLDSARLIRDSVLEALLDLLRMFIGRASRRIWLLQN